LYLIHLPKITSLGLLPLLVLLEHLLLRLLFQELLALQLHLLLTLLITMHLVLNHFQKLD
jgi:hypothetical protein